MKTDSDEDHSTRQKRVNVKIRQMELDDLAHVFHLGEMLFESEKVPNLYRTWDEYEVSGLFNSDSEFCLVAEDADEIVGFALGTTITKTHSAWKYGYLIWLGVHPAYQRLGVAERLFNQFKDRMLKESVRMLLVDTEAENLPALHFFRRHGFGNPQQHIYLTMNLAAECQQLKKKSNGCHRGHARRDAPDLPVHGRPSARADLQHPGSFQRIRGIRGSRALRSLD